MYLKNAEKNVETVMPGFTHLKNAQPISFAHYLLACGKKITEITQKLNREYKLF